jgi:hypothetical protein
MGAGLYKRWRVPPVGQLTWRKQQKHGPHSARWRQLNLVLKRVELQTDGSRVLSGLAAAAKADRERKGLSFNPPAYIKHLEGTAA